MPAADVVIERLESYDADRVQASLVRATEALGWSGAGRGEFGGVIDSGANVVVKPNWVMHANKGPFGIESLVTHSEVIRAVTEAILRADPASIDLGDAPLQGCDFGALLRSAGVEAWARHLAETDTRFRGPHDFRRTRARVSHGVLVQEEVSEGGDGFVLVDLGPDSLLEDISSDESRFRVTQYDPAKMRANHRRGVHRYLVARRFLEADVIVNLPKLKTHRKAGMTGALKNLVGINGNKEYLPHHRVGGAGAGGDAYPGRSFFKRTHERVLDAQNHTTSHRLRRALDVPARALSVISRKTADDLGVEGAWSGNDTVWRMTLDLNRIIQYGRPDGTMADVPQRRVLTVVDASVAGQGDGPLAPEPYHLGLLLAGDDSAAVDYVGARLLGYRPQRIPTVRESFGSFRWRITSSESGSIRAVGPDGRAFGFSDVEPPDRYPQGWLECIDVAHRSRPASGTIYRPPLAQRVGALFTEG